ncbi:MAG TPA: HDOD domain-containing protein [Terriglobia bacterium]|nr:HDOD domain-containing protein [Terriglobia bacterium]
MDNDCLVNRLPVYLPTVEVEAYEVRSRANQAEARAIFNMFKDTGLEQLTGEHDAFISLSPQLDSVALLEGAPKSRLILGYFDDYLPGEIHGETLSGVIQEGYRFALSDRLCQNGLLAMAPQAYAVRLDVTQYAPDELEQRATQLRAEGCRLLATNVDTYDDFEFCKSLNFDFYQGVFLCKPARQKGDIAVNRLAMVHLLSKLQKPNIDMAELEQVISQDVALSYRLLRFSNSAATGLRREVTSIGHALRMAGMDRIRVWASALLLSSVDDKPKELMNTAFVRGKMCEGLAALLKVPEKEPYMFTGFLSVLDALLDCPMAQALEELPLADEVRGALLAHEGRIGQALRCSIAYERAEWEDVQFYGLSSAQIRDTYLNALTWARQLMAGLKA